MNFCTRRAFHRSATLRSSPNNPTPKEPNWLDRLNSNFEAKRAAGERDALTKNKITAQDKARADRFFDTGRIEEERKQLIKQAFREGYYEHAKEIATKGAKLWHAPSRARPIQKSPRMPAFVFPVSSAKDNKKMKEITYLDGSPFAMNRVVGVKKCTLVAFYFNEFGEKHVAAFLSPFLKKYESDPRVGIIEFNVIEQAVKSPIMRLLLPYLRWRLPAARQARYIMLHEEIGDQRRYMGMHNKVVGWVNLVDKDGYIRWQAHGEPTAEELETLMALTERFKMEK